MTSCFIVYYKKKKQVTDQSTDLHELGDDS